MATAYASQTHVFHPASSKPRTVQKSGSMIDQILPDQSSPAASDTYRFEGLELTREQAP